MATYIAKETGRDEDVVLFGLRLFLTSFSGYVALILFAAFWGIFHYALAAAVTVSLFRVFSGGAHATSPLRCNLIGLSVFLTLGFLVKLLPQAPGPLWTATISLVGIFVIYKYVPAETPGKPISSKVQRKYLRIISFILLIAWGMGCTLALWQPTKFVTPDIILSSSLGMMWQLLTLTPIGYRIVGGMDSLLKYLTERR
ncbi:accessory gene regulator ArgB-like protein [Calderihabitans maritimus]|nr:accessory gene regulator B family protein [Calderihabitans maritimus]